MREILFKAKLLDNGEWVEGLLWKKKYKSDKWYISCFPDKDDNEETYVINPETICQYTGLTDKNGNKIWENDVVLYEDAEFDPEGYHDNVFMNKGKVVFHPQCGWFFTNRQTVDMDDLWGSPNCVEAKVIGNIFDNPELLEVEE